jgi:hypothetical protein
MDFTELTKIIYSRIQHFEPDNTIVFFLREPDKQEMVQIAYGSDATLLISYINDAKTDLSTKSPQIHPKSNLISTP